MNLGYEIQKTKKRLNLPVVDESREKEIFDNVKDKSIYDLSSIYSEILSLSKKIQTENFTTTGRNDITSLLNMKEIINHIPSSKSMLQRILALCLFTKESKIIIENVREYGDDVANILKFFDKIGIKNQFDNENNLLIINKNYIDRFNINSFIIPEVVSFGESGLATRMFGVILASIMNQSFTLTGDASLRTRKFTDLLSIINGHGGHAYSINGDDMLPIKIVGRMEIPDKINITDEYKSNQAFSGLAIASLFKMSPTKFNIPQDMPSKGYLLLTLDLIQKMNLGNYSKSLSHYFSGEIELKDKLTYENQKMIRIQCEVDYSSVAYIAGILRFTNTTTYNFLSNPYNSYQPDGRYEFIYEDILSENTSNKVYDLSNTLDLFPVLLLQLIRKKSLLPVTFTGINSLVNKESNRIQACKELFQRFIDIDHDEKNNQVKVSNSIIEKEIPESVFLNTYDDHRIAMCALASTLLYDHQTKITISNIQCINKSFPKFFELFQHLTRRLSDFS